MFTNIDVDQSISILHQKLLDLGIPELVANQIKVLLELCCRKKYCSFKGSAYVFPDGLPMGGSLSSLSANWTVAALEDFHFSKKCSQPVGFWCRYVDIFCV